MTDYLVRLFRIGPSSIRYGDSRGPTGGNAGVRGWPQRLRGQASRGGVAGTLPFTGKDVAAGFMFKTPFFYGLDTALADLTAPASHKATPPVGSNGVAVAPSRSADGATRLLVNSHQPYPGPLAWYEAVVETGQGWHVAGGFFPGTPFMLHGHNAHLGWANTVNQPDLVDVYRLTSTRRTRTSTGSTAAGRRSRKRDTALRMPPVRRL